MFKVPIIPPDLRHEETIIQAANALDCLQTTIVTIFARIDKRIEKNNGKIKELQDRINKSQAKINNLQGTRKAIRIYAPARFPAGKIFRDLPVTFNEDCLDIKPKMKYKVESKLDTNIPNFSEKLIFFHVRERKSEKLNAENNLAGDRCNIKQNQNKGTMPSDLRSISSVLLFNTDISVYNLEDCDKETSSQSDAWRRAKLLKNKRQQGNHQAESGKKILEPPPHSLIHRRSEMLTPSGGLKYTPKLSEPPELNLPLDLPDLPGIADDLRFDSPEAKQKIAPSLEFVVENLPELSELLKDNDINTHIFTEEPHINNPIPVPPPPPPIRQFTAPPPPPPPPVKELKLAKGQSYTNHTTTPVSPTSSDSRSELMAAIRSAGGIGKVRLRPTAASPLISNEHDVVDTTPAHSHSTKKPNVPKGGDLMADLHNKLLMRRKGISGSKENKDDSYEKKNIGNMSPVGTPSGNPVISRLSALIPPPPAMKSKARNTANTSEEDEADDSNDADWVD